MVLSTISEVSSICGVNEKRARFLLSNDILPSITTGGGNNRVRYYLLERFVSFTKNRFIKQSKGVFDDTTSDREVFLSQNADTSPHTPILGKEAKTIVFSNLKGGVGKTTATINIAAALAKLGQRVLIIDMDSQSQSSKYFEKRSYRGKSILSLFEKLKNEEEVHRKETLEIVQKFFLSDFGAGKGEIDVLPSEIGLPKLLEVIKISKIRPEIYLDKILSSVKMDYDFILIDTSPYPGIPLQMSFYAADEIVLATEAEEFSVEGLETTIAEITELKKYIEKPLYTESIFVKSYSDMVHQQIHLDQIYNIAAKYIGSNANIYSTKNARAIFGMAQSLMIPVFAYKKKPKESLSVSADFFKYAIKKIEEREGEFYA